MQAARIIEQVQDHRLTLTMPEAFNKKRVEVIVLPYDEESTPRRTIRRKPSPLVAGMRITGDILAPACPPDAWDALK